MLLVGFVEGYEKTNKEKNEKDIGEKTCEKGYGWRG